MKKTVVFLALLALLSACAMDPRLTEQSQVYVDTWVKRDNPAVFVQPMNAPSRPFKAVILPFDVQQDVRFASNIGKQLTEVLWQGWNKEQAFPSLFYEPTMLGVTKEQAILIGRDRGADCVVMGHFSYILNGGTQSDSTISMAFDIFDVNTGQRIWSMAHTGRIDPGLLRTDYVLFTRNARMPMDPMWSIMMAMAADTGGILKKWNNGQQYQSPGASSVPVSTPKPQDPPPAPKKPLQSSVLQN
jgi:hypothetical protein